jgi:hypothetical protein
LRRLCGIGACSYLSSYAYMRDEWRSSRGFDTKIIILESCSFVVYDK